MSATGRSAAEGRYATAAIALHWLIALAIVIQLCLGWYMNEGLPDHSAAQAQVEGIHISWGLTILLLVLLRIAVRFIYRTPPEPPGMGAWERWLARLSHLLFYLLMLALPLTGWAIVSMRAPPISFWGLPWPHLPGVSQLLGAPVPKPVRRELVHIHVYILIWITLITLALHVAGALYHQLRGPSVLWRMIPIGRPRTAA